MLVQASINLPPFWRSFPALWFYQVETEFRKQQIFSEPTMKFYILKSLKPNIIAEVEETLTSPLEELPYYLLKQALQSISKLPPSVRHVPYLASVIQSISKYSTSLNDASLRPPPASVFPKPTPPLPHPKASPNPVSKNSNTEKTTKATEFPIVPVVNQKTKTARANNAQAKNKSNSMTKEIVKYKPAKRILETDSSGNDDEHVRTVSPRAQQTALIKLLKHLLELMKKKDKERFFKQPVTADIAPDYFAVIRLPMDFFTMDKKLKADKYTGFTEFRSDAELICKNAMVYNHRLSIFYLKARDLQNYIDSIFDMDSISLLAKNFPYIKDIPYEKLGFDVDESVEKKKVNLKKEEKNESDELSEYEKLRAKNIAARMKMFEDMKISAVKAVESIKPPVKRVKKELKEEDFIFPKIERKSSRIIKAIDYKEPRARMIKG